MPSSHVTIVGAGIIGISTAAFLQRSGHKVTVIDRVPTGEGCSFGNAGGIAFAEVTPTIHPRILMKIPGWLLDPLGSPYDPLVPFAQGVALVSGRRPQRVARPGAQDHGGTRGSRPACGQRF